MDGSRVEEMILAGQIDEVARYCESDVLNNFRVWLMYELFRGSINTAELGWSERQVGDYVTTRKATNPHLAVHSPPHRGHCATFSNTNGAE